MKILIIYKGSGLIGEMVAIERRGFNVMATKLLHLVIGVGSGHTKTLRRTLSDERV